jgi:hypothetical protein
MNFRLGRKTRSKRVQWWRVGQRMDSGLADGVPLIRFNVMRRWRTAD